MTQIEDDGDITVHPPITAAPRRFDKPYADAGFAAWQRMQSAEFEALMAFKHGDSDALRQLRDRLQNIVADIDAALFDAKAETLAATREASLAKASATWLAKQEARE